MQCVRVYGVQCSMLNSVFAFSQFPSRSRTYLFLRQVLYLELQVCWRAFPRVWVFTENG